MNKTVNGVVCAGILTLAAASVDAALLSRLGGMAVYDTDLDITWLADANAAAGTIFDDGFSNSDGRLTWNNALAWADSLTIGGFNDWRLPLTPDPDSTCIGNATSLGAEGFNCTGSELGHLFYDELGGTAFVDILDSTDPDLAMFSNIQAAYWSGTEIASDTSLAWGMSYKVGLQAGTSKVNTSFAWAVRDGDVGTVSEPSMLALLGIGLIGFMTYGRNRS
ncbi:MAG: DUF1566 domain-containing protein [Nitrosomonas sp.]|nr:DUF1566 domain-containing protein [Nitrosomonas sp.]